MFAVKAASRAYSTKIIMQFRHNAAVAEFQFRLGFSIVFRN